MKFFCINLKKSKQRRRFVTEEFVQHNIKNVQFIDGIDGNDLNVDFKIISENIPKFKQMNNGRLGCFLSHSLLWNMLKHDDKESVYVIFEDDIKIVRDITIENILPSYHWDIIYMGYTHEIIHTFGTPLSRGEALCTHAYIINKETANFLLDNIFPIDAPVDMKMRDLLKNKNSFLLSAPLAIQLSSPNEIGEYKSLTS